MALISLIHPSRGRAQKSWQTTRRWIERAGCETELIVSIDDNDPERGEYLRLYHQASPFNTKVISNPNRSAVDAINRAATEAKGDIFLILSDDTECNDKWGISILQAVDGRSDFVLRVSEGIQKWIVTMPVFDRAYYNRFGYVYYTEYLHQFCDTEFTHVATLLGKIIRRDDLYFEHAHYSKGKATKDEVYKRSDATVNQGKEVYVRRFKQCFGLEGHDPWNLPPEAAGHVQWCKNVGL